MDKILKSPRSLAATKGEDKQSTIISIHIYTGVTSVYSEFLSPNIPIEKLDKAFQYLILGGSR